MTGDIEIRNRWRELQYPHLDQPTFERHFADHDNRGWDDVRKEVSAVTTLVGESRREVEAQRDTEAARLNRRLDQLYAAFCVMERERDAAWRELAQLKGGTHETGDGVVAVDSVSEDRGRADRPASVGVDAADVSVRARRLDLPIDGVAVEVSSRAEMSEQAERDRATLREALADVTAMCGSAAVWPDDDVQGLRYHALEAAKRGREVLSTAARPVTPPTDWHGWLVIRKRGTDPWEVYPFDRYDQAAITFDSYQQQWSDTFLCRVAFGPGKPIGDVPTYRVVEAARPVTPTCAGCRDGECPLHLGTPSHLGAPPEPPAPTPDYEPCETCGSKLANCECPAPPSAHVITEQHVEDVFKQLDRGDQTFAGAAKVMNEIAHPDHPTLGYLRARFDGGR